MPANDQLMRHGGQTALSHRDWRKAAPSHRPTCPIVAVVGVTLFEMCMAGSNQLRMLHRPSLSVKTLGLPCGIVLPRKTPAEGLRYALAYVEEKPVAETDQDLKCRMEALWGTSAPDRTTARDGLLHALEDIDWNPSDAVDEASAKRLMEFAQQVLRQRKLYYLAQQGIVSASQLAGALLSNQVLRKILRGYKPDQPFKPWVAMCLRNLALDAGRKHQREKERASRPPPKETPTDPEQALSQLAPGYAAVFNGLKCSRKTCVDSVAVLLLETRLAWAKKMRAARLGRPGLRLAATKSTSEILEEHLRWSDDDGRRFVSEGFPTLSEIWRHLAALLDAHVRISRKTVANVISLIAAEEGTNHFLSDVAYQKETQRLQHNLVLDEPTWMLFKWLFRNHNAIGNEGCES